MCCLALTGKLNLFIITFKFHEKYFAQNSPDITDVHLLTIMGTTG